MTTANWDAVRALFHRMLDCEPDEQRALLREIAARDERLAAEVTGLLAAHQAAGDFLDEPARDATVGGARATSLGTPVLKPGDRFGSFDIIGVAGRGGMGEVYRARDLRLDRIVALKVVPDRWADDERARERFTREARAISRLNHPHICTLYDLASAAPAPGTREVPFLVMEFLEGCTLAERLTAGPLSPREALSHALAMAHALMTAHAQGVVHRDLKPGNVMLTPAGVKLNR